MDTTGRFGGLSNRSAIILVAALAVGLIHHMDHVLRFDHSGWPFRPEVNPFTFSLLAYPIGLFAPLGPARLFWLRWFVLLAGTGFTLWAHSLIETPAMQYAMWAHNHTLEPKQPHAHNLLGVQSNTLGILAVSISMTLCYAEAKASAASHLDTTQTIRNGLHAFAVSWFCGKATYLDLGISRSPPRSDVLSLVVDRQCHPWSRTENSN
jgi:hypothetical protein